MAGCKFHQEKMKMSLLNPFVVLERKVGNRPGKLHYLKKLIPLRKVKRKCKECIYTHHLHIKTSKIFPYLLHLFWGAGGGLSILKYITLIMTFHS